MGEAAGMDSQNYLATLTGEDKMGRDYVIEASGSLSISDGEWKYITPNKGPAYNKLTNTELGNSEDEQLYNLHEDVGEKQNVAKKYPDKVKEMKQILEQEKQKGFREEWVY